MNVAFFKLDEGRICGWNATPAHRRPFPGSTMASGRDLPHDLAQFVVEQALDLDLGFWGLLSKGATFASVPGRRRTKPGREVIRQNQAELDRVEGIVNAHVGAWRTGRPTPLAPALSTMLERWRALQPGEAIHVVWSTKATADHPNERTKAKRRHSTR
jgi:hypothetical protein